MISGLIKAPSRYFDVTHTGVLINNFSNDMGILDQILPILIIDVVEGPTIILLFFANIASVDLYFIATGLIALVLFVLIIWYFKDTMVAIKILVLKLKNPVFSKANEMLSGLVQLRIYQKRYYVLK